ncbi:MAG TPA: efflux RND transporter periplasmic adaptor subunit [Stellaceae bacterium]|nr:efflux RND transporter periplasmic adaptor subunit [Stellaceae bacterium]
MRGIRLAGCLAALGVLGLWAAQHYLRADGTAANQARLAVPVRTAIAEARPLPVFVRGIGHVVPENQVQVRSRVDGQIERVFYVEGQEVAAGDPLIEIDPRPYKAALAQAEGQLAQHQAQLASAKADQERSRSLLEKGFASRQTFDQQTAAAGQLAAAIATDQGAVDAARLNLSFTTLRAPIAGRVGKRLVDAGNIVHASDTAALVEIVQRHPIAVLFTVPQGELSAIREGQKTGDVAVEAWSEDESGRLAAGKLTLIGNEIDPATGTIELKAGFDNRDDALWPGQFVNARVITRMRENALAVPEAAVQPGPQGRFVYVVDGQSVVHVRPVKVGPPVPGAAVIEEGISAGDRVVIDQQDQLAPEAPVRVIGDEKSPAQRTAGTAS